VCVCTAKPAEPNNYKKLCACLLQGCCISIPVRFAYCERNGNVLEAIAWFIQ
jgi:hypothetical protein